MQEKVIAINPYLLQKFMGYKKDYANLLALYTFYLYHADKQNSDSILATDKFTKNGLNWALDRVKRIKRILKAIGVIVVEQKGYYSYIKLRYLYGKRIIDELIGYNKELRENNKVLEVENDLKEDKKVSKIENNLKEDKKVSKVENNLKEDKKVSKVEDKPKDEEKTIFVRVLEENNIKKEKIEDIRDYIENKNKFLGFNQLALAKWIGYCHRNKIAYNNNSIKAWIKKIKLKPSIEQLEAIDDAIENSWNDFYIPSKEESKYQKYIGRDIYYRGRLYTNLIDIEYNSNCYLKRSKEKK